MIDKNDNDDEDDEDDDDDDVPVVKFQPRITGIICHVYCCMSFCKF